MLSLAPGAPAGSSPSHLAPRHHLATASRWSPSRPSTSASTRGARDEAASAVAVGACLAGSLCDRARRRSGAKATSSIASGNSAAQKSDRPSRDPPSLGDVASVVAVEGKGLGVVADRPIRKGERVLVETPLLKWEWSEEFESFWESKGAQVPRVLEEDLREQVASLSSEEQELFWSMSSGYKADLAIGICLTNGLPAPDRYSDIDCGAFCAMGCRFNHSCVANVNTTWHFKRNEFVFHAMRDIEPGEELTIFYNTQLMFGTQEQRKEDLLERFLFECQCEACVLTGKAREESDERRLTMGALDATVQKTLKNSLRRWKPILRRMPRLRIHPDKLAALLERLDELVDKELGGNTWVKANHKFAGFQIASSGKEQELAEDLLRQALELAQSAEGEDGTMAEDAAYHLRRLAREQAARAREAEAASPSSLREQEEQVF